MTKEPRQELTEGSMTVATIERQPPKSLNRKNTDPKNRTENHSTTNPPPNDHAGSRAAEREQPTNRRPESHRLVIFGKLAESEPNVKEREKQGEIAGKCR